jgi:hypothetical protein
MTAVEVAWRDMLGNPAIRMNAVWIDPDAETVTVLALAEGVTFEVTDAI